MGGVVIILATVVGYFGALLITQTAPSASALLLLFLFVGMGLVGFLDDYIKIVQAAQPRPAQQGEDDRPDRDRASSSACSRSRRGSRTRTARRRPRRRSRSCATSSWLALPMVLAVLLIWLIIVATSNGVNLTDGLDGLATGACVMVFGGVHAREHLAEQPVLRRRPDDRSATTSEIRSTSRSWRPRSPARASASCGGTPRRPRSSWATPARCRSAPRSPASRS